MSLKIGMIVYPKGYITPQLYRVADISGHHVDLKPISLGAVPIQSPASDLRRYRVRATDEVVWHEQLVEVERLLNPFDDGLYRYEIDIDGQRQEVPEYELTIHEGSLAPDPAAMLGQFDLAPWDLVAARSSLLDAYFNATARSMGIVGYNGARMLPIPHQINAARYALQFGRIRFLLADEVGLGKTVEAGLILSTLRKYFPSWKTAIFVPESLTAQWAFEMYGKFGKLVFNLEESGDEMEEEEEDVGVILPHQRAKAYAVRSKPDILIVDEAHRILRDKRLVQAYIRMSRTAHAVLLLTATPVSDDSRNLLQLFQLLDPEEFARLTSTEYLRELQQAEGAIESFLRAIRRPHPTAAEARECWKQTNIDDSEIEALLRPQDDQRAGRHALHHAASLAVDRYYPGSRMLRYRRKFLAQDNPLPFRIVDSLEYKPTPEEEAVYTATRQWLDLVKDAGLDGNAGAQRVTAALLQAAYSSPLALLDWLAARRGTLERHEGVTADPVLLATDAMKELRLAGEGPILDALEEAAAAWNRATRAIDATLRPLARSSRFQSFISFLADLFANEPDSHVLVFTGFESNVHPLYLLLRKALSPMAEIFEMSGLQSRIEREKNAFEFQEISTGTVLISDELGGEGRNFQFATHVVHYDLPLAPWIVEQRIGRCDRVGRDEELDVDSLVIVAKGQLDEAFFDFLTDGVGVFNESIAPVEAELDPLMSESLRACIDKGATGVLDMIEDTAERLEQARNRENAELLVRHAVGVEEAHRIADELNDEAELLALRQSTLHYARLFESMVDERPNGRVAITVGEFHSLHAIPGVSAEMVGYFDRREAVRHERLDFFSPGHPFVRGLAQMAMIESPDRAAIIRRQGIIHPTLAAYFRVSIPPEFIKAVRQLPVDMQPPLLSRSARLFATRMVQAAVDLKGNPVDLSNSAGLHRIECREGDISCHDRPQIVDMLPENWHQAVRDLTDILRDLVIAHIDETLPQRRDELEDLLCEVLTRVHPHHELLESQIESIISHFDELNVDLDSIVLLIPG